VRQALLVALGGALGTTSRYLVGTWVPHVLPGSSIPLSTLAVNVVGGFLIGLLAGGQHFSQEVRGMIVVGFLGGFTTFSAFSWDTAGLATGGHPRCALLNVALTVCLTLAGTWLGMRLRGSGA
jgi:fluoride exporter